MGVGRYDAGMNRTLPFVALVAVSIFFVGCQTDEPGVSSGPLSQSATFPVGVTEASDATVAVFKEMKFSDVKVDGSTLESRIEGKSAGATVVADVDRVTDDSSEVTVRYGTLGDRELGKTLLRAVGEELGEAPIVESE